MHAGTNPALATLLTPKIGYLKAAEIAHESVARQRPVRDIAVEKGILTKEEADAMFDLKAVAQNRYRDEGAGTGYYPDEQTQKKKKRRKQI